MRTKLAPALAAAFVALALSGPPAHAQQTIAMSYSVVPKTGMTTQFEAALKNHVAWRVANGDPWTWGVSMRVAGDELGEYGIRSSGHSWADLDAYDAEFGPMALANWMATVQPLVESVSNSISVINEDWSHRPPQGRAVNLVNIATFHVRPGQQDRFNELVGQATSALKAANVDWYWLFSTPAVGGGMGPVWNVVGLADSWIDMEPRDDEFMEALVAHMGNDGAEEWAGSFGQVIRGTESEVRRLRPDLGTVGAN